MQPSEPSLPAQIGRYRIVRMIGQGAMGRVLLAHDPVLDRDVALKHLRNDLGISLEQRTALLERMRQEARASARVSHPNIVMLHDMGEDEAIGLYLVFEYAEGSTLKDRLGLGPLPPDAVGKLARAVGEALTTAHDAGVLHRDIKPENVILTKTGPKIADFGIARVPDSTLTRDGGLLGTPAYSAPEAISNGAFSPASDQFSLAAMLWEALCGRRAFPGDDAVAVASRIATEDPPKIAAVCSLDPHVDTVLARGLSKNPGARYTTAEEFGRALAEALEVSPRNAMVTLPDQHHREAVQRLEESRVLRIGVGGAAVGALLVLATWQLLKGLRAPPPLPLPLPVVSAAPSSPPPAATRDEAEARRGRVHRSAVVELRPERKPRDAGVGDAHSEAADAGDAGADLADAGDASDARADAP